MKPKFFFRFLAALLVCVITLSAHAATARPNILIVLVDDAGYGDFGCHGHPFLKTPNIDRLHGESVRFTDFHVAPMCSPTRGQLMSGMDALHNGATSVTAGRAFMRPNVVTMPQILAGSGYKTGIFGKWHLGDNYPNRPMEKGFQTAVWLKGWGFTSAPEFANTLFDGRCYRGATESKFKGYITDFCFDEAMQWMRERKTKNEPFFCYLPLNAAHAPCIVADKYSEPFKGKGAAGFFGMIANIDENMGRLETFLTDTGLRDNTIVVFMSDNGGTGGVQIYNAGLRDKKTTYYQGGHIAPCFVRWPAGQLRAPGDIAVPTQIQDLLPTFLELGNVKKPSGAAFDGTSLAALLKGSADTLPDRLLVVQYGQIPEKWDSCVIWNQWRLIKGKELYDFRVDRGETRDVAAQHADVVAKMRTHYETWWAGVEPTLNDFVAISAGATQENPVIVSSSDWQNIYADNDKHVRSGAGGEQGGAWNVNVERAGEYEIALRRWPFELDLALAGTDKPGDKRMPVHSAKLNVAGQELSAPATPDAKEIVFRVKLPKGRTQLHGWFQDSVGNDLCGAYYAKVKRL